MKSFYDSSWMTILMLLLTGSHHLATPFSAGQGLLFRNNVHPVGSFTTTNNDNNKFGEGTSTNSDFSHVAACFTPTLSSSRKSESTTTRLCSSSSPLSTPPRLELPLNEDEEKKSSSRACSSESNHTSRIVETIASVSALLSYQCAEDRLAKALAAWKDETNAKRRGSSPLLVTKEIRGELEDVVLVVDDNHDESSKENIVDLFLSTLAAAMMGNHSVSEGLAACNFLLQHALVHSNNDDEVTANNNDNNNPTSDDDAACVIKTLQFTPPTRTLIGIVNGMDIHLLRDKEDAHRRFTLLFSQDRAKGRKMARLHAEMEIDDNNDTMVVYIRGVHVQDSYRQQGLSTLILAVFSDMCRVVLGKYPETRLMNKPLLCVALHSLGFQPESNKWPVLVAPHLTNQEITLMSPCLPEGADDNDDERKLDWLGPQFPHAVRRAQKLERVPHLDPKQARKIHVLTRFLPPPPPPLVESASSTTQTEFPDPIMARLANCEYQLYSARIVAFFSTLDNAKEAMFRRSQGVQDYQWDNALIDR